MSTRTLAAALLLTAATLGTARAQFTVNNGGGVDPNSVAVQSATNQAQADLNRALGGLRAAQERIQADFKAAPELWQAEDDLEAAQKELEAAAKPILARLTDSPEWKEEKRKQDEYDAKIKEEFRKGVEADPASTRPSSTSPADGKPGDGATAAATSERLNVPVPSDAQIAAATDKAIQRNKLRQMQEAAIAGDPTAAAAAAKVEAAVENLKRLNLTHRAALLNHPEFKAALDSVHSARASVQRAASTNYGYGAYGSYGYVR